MTKHIKLGLFAFVTAILLFFSGIFMMLPTTMAKAEENTMVTITWAGAEDPTYKTINLAANNGSSTYEWVDGTALYNGTETAVRFVWANASVLQIATPNNTWANGDTIIIAQGSTFTTSEATYEFAIGYKLTYNGAWSGEAYTYTEPVANTLVTITWAGAEDPTYKTINLAANNGSSKYEWVDGTVLYNGAETAVRFVWANASVLQIATPNNTWANGDVIIIAEGSTFTTSEATYEFASGYKLTYNGAWSGEAYTESVENTLVTITGLGAADATYGTINFVTDITGATEWKFCDTFPFEYNGAEKQIPFGWIGANVMQTQGFMGWTEGDVLTIKAGTTFSVNAVDTVYEIVNDYTIYYYANAWHTNAYVAPVEVELMALRGTSAATVRQEGDGILYMMYFDTDMTGVENTWTGWENAAAVVINGTTTVLGNACFSDATGLYIQIVTAETVENLTIAAGTQLTINDTLYAVKNDFTVYYFDGMLSATEKVEEHTYTDIEIKDLILLDSNLFIYTKDSYGYNDWATLNHGDLTVTYCGETIAPLKLTNTDKCMIIQELSIDLDSFVASDVYPYPTITFSAGDAYNYVIKPAVRLLEDITFYYYDGLWITTVPTLTTVNYQSVDNTQSTSSVIYLKLDGAVGIEANSGLAKIATQISVNGYNLAKEGADYSVLVVDENTLRLDLGMMLYFENEAYERTTVVISAGANDYVGANGFSIENEITLYYRKDVGLWVTSIDTTAPVISYSGALTLTATEGDDLPEITATATDETDGNLETVITYSEGAIVDGKLVAGTHTITISAVDAQKNAAEELVITLTVEAKIVTPPDDSSSDSEEYPDDNSGDSSDNNSQGSASEEDNSSADSDKNEQNSSSSMGFGCFGTVSAIGIIPMLLGVAVLCLKKRKE